MPRHRPRWINPSRRRRRNLRRRNKRRRKRKRRRILIPSRNSLSKTSRMVVLGKMRHLIMTIPSLASHARRRKIVRRRRPRLIRSYAPSRIGTYVAQLVVRLVHPNCCACLTEVALKLQVLAQTLKVPLVVMARQVHLMMMAVQRLIHPRTLQAQVVTMMVQLRVPVMVVPRAQVIVQTVLRQVMKIPTRPRITLTLNQTFMRRLSINVGMYVNDRRCVLLPAGLDHRSLRLIRILI